jgi:hypothetical protein
MNDLDALFASHPFKHDAHHQNIFLRIRACEFKNWNPSLNPNSFRKKSNRIFKKVKFNKRRE